MPQFRPKLPAIGSKQAERVADASASTVVPPETKPVANIGSGVGTEKQAGGPAGASSLSVVAEATPQVHSGGLSGQAPRARAAAQARLKAFRETPRPFLHLPTINVPSWSAIESSARELLAGPAEAARPRMQNPRELSDSIAMGRAIWRDLVIGFASQLGELNLGFTQLAALYALEDSGTMTVSDMADTIGRSPSATSRLVNSLVTRQLVERRQDSEDRRIRTLAMTGRGKAVLGRVDRARAEEFLAIVRPLATRERAVVAMGVAALSTSSISKRGHLIKMPRSRSRP